MKTRIALIACIAMLLPLSCNKAVESPVQGPAETVTITASIPDPVGTRVAAGDAETGLSWAWEAGDKITVIGTTPSVFDIEEGFEPQKATFTGKPVTGDKYSIIYPGTVTSASGLEALSWDAQVQQGNDSKAHLQYFALLGDVDAFDTFEFSPDWAAAHGGTFRQGGVLRFKVTLPEGTTSVNKLTVAAATPLFHAGNGDATVNELSLTLDGATLGEDRVLTAWMTTSWHDDTLPEGTVLSFTVAAGDMTWIRDITLSGEKVIKSGCVNTVTLDGEGWFDAGRYDGGKGTESEPWLISTAQQLLYMKDDLKGGEKRWFKLAADIDMTEITGWEPLNYASPYDKEIDFDGDGHTITGFTCDYGGAYPSFFGVLYGTCHDVTFSKAKIVGTANSACGIIGGYAGTGDKHAEILRVHVQGTVTFTGNKTGVGGMVGIIGNGNITASSANCKVSSTKNYVGGLFGYDGGKTTIRDCWTAGSVIGGQRTGGICGGLIKDGSAIYNCYSASAVTAGFAIGGIAGHMNQDKGDAAATRMPGNVVEKCVAWNTFVRSNSFLEGDKSHYSGGAVVGFTATHNFLTDCVRKPEFDFLDYSDLFVLYDQENASDEIPLVVVEVEGANYNFPYHGKAAAEGKTLSQVAQELGWSSEVWDFSGAYPVHVGQPELIVDQAGSNGQIGDFGENPFI